MITSFKPNDRMRLTCEIRIRKIGDDIFLIPITNTVVSGRGFYKLNKCGELIVKRIELDGVIGISFENLLDYLFDIFRDKKRDTVSEDVVSFLILIQEYGLLEVI